MVFNFYWFGLEFFSWFICLLQKKNKNKKNHILIKIKAIGAQSRAIVECSMQCLARISVGTLEQICNDHFHETTMLLAMAAMKIVTQGYVTSFTSENERGGGGRRGGGYYSGGGQNGGKYGLGKQLALPHLNINPSTSGGGSDTYSTPISTSNATYYGAAGGAGHSLVPPYNVRLSFAKTAAKILTTGKNLYF